jgi:mannose-1-phosphate guanylyltransferase
MTFPTQAFVLGAGLGTRLRPLTDVLPKPLVPVFNRPLITYAFDHLHAAGVNAFLINTHHLPEAYGKAFPAGTYQECPLTFRHEPELLDTGGGIANIADLITGDALWIYNGDILCDIDLTPIWETHQQSGNAATLLLLENGDNCNVAMNPQTQRVTDMRGTLGSTDPLYQFTGIYLVSADFARSLLPIGVKSVVPALLEAIQNESKVGAVVASAGLWFDLGNRASYLEAHRILPQSGFPAYGGALPPAIHPGAHIDATASVDSASVVGAGAFVGEGTYLRSSILWPEAYVCPGSFLGDCILTGREPVRGNLNGKDI